MAQFAFTGDPKARGHDPASAEMFGKKFPLGEMVDVTDEEAEKLKTNSHFTEGKGDVAKARKEAEEAAEKVRTEQREAAIRRAEVAGYAVGDGKHPAALAAETAEEPGAQGAAMTAEAKEKEAQRIIERTGGNPSIEAQPDEVGDKKKQAPPSKKK
jgi:hypothetical protein